MGRPSRVTVPLDGARKPAIRLMRVDLPAPFGPSRPVTPGPMVIVTSLTATTLPNQREVWSISIVVMGGSQPDLAVAAHQDAVGGGDGAQDDQQVDDPET